MNAFTFSTCKQVIVEAGAASRLSEYLETFESVLIITDPGIDALGLHKPAITSLINHGTRVQVYKDIQADPPESVVLDAINTAVSAKAEAIIGFGGGSSMDVAKIVALLAHPENTQNLQAIYGVNNARGKRLPLIQIPTTAGTGSEVTQVAIVTTGETTKMGAVTPLFLPDIAVLDCELTLGLPPSVTAATGIDAMVHAIEAYTSKIKKNPMSDMMAKEALRLLSKHIPTAVHSGNDKSAREGMLLGAMLAGQAFANAPVAAVHALAYPLGGHFHIPHGLSNSLVLPQVMRFNLPEASGHYAELAPLIFPDEFSEMSSIQQTRQHDAEHEIEIADKLINLIEALIEELGLPARLRDMNIPEDYLPTLAEDAMKQTRLLVNNPREVTYESALDIYRAAY